MILYIIKDVQFKQGQLFHMYLRKCSFALGFGVIFREHPFPLRTETDEE